MPEAGRPVHRPPGAGRARQAGGGPGGGRAREPGAAGRSGERVNLATRLAVFPYPRPRTSKHRFKPLGGRGTLHHASFTLSFRTDLPRQRRRRPGETGLDAYQSVDTILGHRGPLGRPGCRGPWAGPPVAAPADGPGCRSPGGGACRRRPLGGLGRPPGCRRRWAQDARSLRARPQYAAMRSGGTPLELAVAPVGSRCRRRTTRRR